MCLVRFDSPYFLTVKCTPFFYLSKMSRILISSAVYFLKRGVSWRKLRNKANLLLTRLLSRKYKIKSKGFPKLKKKKKSKQSTLDLRERTHKGQKNDEILTDDDISFCGGFFTQLTRPTFSALSFTINNFARYKMANN